MTKTLDQYTSPTRKVIAMLHAGRDKLREKYAVVRENLRTAENQVRAVEKSREMWRQRAEAALAAAQKNMTDHSSASPAVV